MSPAKVQTFNPFIARNLLCLLISALMFFFSCSVDDSLIHPGQLKTEYLENPYIDTRKPRFSWVLTSKGFNKSQSAYQILVASKPELLNEKEADMWNTEKVGSSSTNQIEYNGSRLQARNKYYWKVCSWDEKGKRGPWSDTGSFEMGFLRQAEWEAKWIGNDLTHLGKGHDYHLPPVPYLRKETEIGRNIRSARLYVTALGVYDFYINGKKVGHQLLAPGWTNYHKRVYYHVFDVKEYLKEGNNALGSMLSYGWYAGYIGYMKYKNLKPDKAFWGEVPKLLAQLEIEYEEGTREVIITDSTWKTSQGALLESDILQGETYDARLEPQGWKTTGFDDSEWTIADVFESPGIAIQVHPAQPIVYTEELKPRTIIMQPDDGSYIFDMGQNFAGVVTLNVKGEAGQKIILKYGEMLHPDGRLMTENLRSARATDTYILNGDPQGEEWTPQFTFHGFQFVQIFGLPERPDSNTITAKVIGSDIPSIGNFECSHDMVNQLYSNIIWTQRANFIDIPTDCPQRDERMGWTGDAQIYIGSAILNADVSAFFTKWITGLNDDQFDNGAYPNYSPVPYLIGNKTHSPGWMEAGVICPYYIYKSYGDTRLIDIYWQNMEDFMQLHISKAGTDYIHKEASWEEIDPNGGYSDWLSVGVKTAPELITSMYFAYCCKLMAEMADALGKSDRAVFYKNLDALVCSGIEDHYWDADKNIFKCNEAAYGDGEGYVDGDRGFTGHTQTAYANAIYMNILDDEKSKYALDNLVKLIEDNNSLLSTGFLGVKQLLPAVSKSGRSDLAYTLLLNTEYPSWGFEIENGATTIWERWNSYTREEGFVEGMNSFSHYSFGSVYEWMFNHMAGIKNAGVAYDSIVIQPEFDNRIEYVKAKHQSVNGEISSNWNKTEEQINLAVEIPVNSVANIVLPFGPDQIQMDGLSSEEYTFIRKTDKTIIPVGSGRYSIQINL